jgi:hypothetical protein
MLQDQPRHVRARRDHGYLHDWQNASDAETETDRFLDFHSIGDYKLAREIFVRQGCGV